MRNILNISAALCAGISIFRLMSLLLEMRISEIIQGIIETYQRILEPIVVVLGPLFVKIAIYFDFNLPFFWPHIFVVWVILGGIAGRAFISEVKETEPSIKYQSFILIAAFTLGPFFLLLSFAKSIWNANKENFYFFWYIFRETSFVALSAIVFFAANSFTLNSTYLTGMGL